MHKYNFIDISRIEIYSLQDFFWDSISNRVFFNLARISSSLTSTTSLLTIKSKDPSVYDSVCIIFFEIKSITIYKRYYRKGVQPMYKKFTTQ